MNDYTKDDVIRIGKAFRSDIWDRMCAEERRTAVKELAAYSAARSGRQPCEVRFEPIDGFTGGYELNGRITLNSNLIDHSKYVVSSKRAESPDREYLINGSGIQVMNVVFHEDTHAQQEFVRGNAALAGNEQRARDLQAGGRLNTYVQPEVDYSLYRIQPVEEEAFSRGIDETISLFEATNAVYGEDPNYKAFAEENQSSQNDYRRQAAIRYNDDLVQETLAAVIRDRYYGTHETYSSESAKQIEAVLDASYAIHQSQQAAKAEDRSALKPAAANAEDDYWGSIDASNEETKAQANTHHQKNGHKI